MTYSVCVCVRVCVCGRSYSACKAHVPYYIVICVLVLPYQISPHFLINGTILWKEVTEHKMCVLSFCTTFDWNISLSKKNTADIAINIHRSSCTVPLILFQILMNLEFSRQIFERFSNIKFRENPYSRSGVVPWGRGGRTDVRTETNNRFLKFCERA